MLDDSLEKISTDLLYVKPKSIFAASFERGEIAQLVRAHDS